jgi:hypothetical protein
MFAASKTSRAAAAVLPDPFFDNVTLLLEDTGTNGAQNNTFIDSSTNNFTITRNGNTTQGALSPYGANWSNYFDGTGDYLSVASNAAFGYGTGAFTIECWFNTQVIPPLGGDYLFDQRTTSSQAAMLAYITPSASLEVVVNGAAIITGGTVVVGTWNHFALAKSGTTTRMFLNGVQVGSSYTDNINYVSPAPVVIASRFSAEDFYQGHISNFRIVKGTALYTANFTPSTVPLQPVAGTGLLTCANPNIVDNSANQFTVTRFGDVSVQKFGPFAGTTLTTPYYGGYFDGTGDSLTVPSNSNWSFAGEFTLEGWFYWNITSSAGTVCGVQSAGGLGLYSTGSNVSPNVFGSGNVFNSTFNPVAGIWYHIALTRNSSNLMTLWVNGVSVGSATTSASYTAGTYTINTTSNNNVLQGHISNFRIVNGTAVYTSTFTPPTAPLTAISGTNLLTCQSNTFIDNSTNNFALTVTGNTRPTTFAPFAVTYSSLQSYTPAVFGGSMYFDGTGDYLTAPVNAAFDFGTGDFTIEAWANFASVGITQNIINNYNGTGTAGWGLQWRNDTSTYTFFSGSTTILTFAVVPALNTWNHIAVSRSGTTLRMFFNGAQVATVTNSTNLTSTLAPAIGNLFASGQGYAFPYFGYMSNVRVVKGTAVYTSSFVPQNAPLTAVTNTSLLLNATNAGIYDASTINNFETVGNAQVSTSVKKYGTSSVAFDGTGDFLTFPSGVAYRLIGSFTVETWVYPVVVNATQPMLCIGDSFTNPGILFYISSSARVAILYGNAVALTGSTNVIANTWNHVAFVRNGSTITAYLNGVSQGTVTNSNGFSGTNTLIGRELYNGAVGGQLNGYMQDLRITSGIARYTANFTPPTAALPTF